MRKGAAPGVSGSPSWGSEMYCVGCGAKLADGARFCVNCGLPVGASATGRIAAQPGERSSAQQDGQSGTGQATRFQVVDGDDLNGSGSAHEQKQTFKQFLMKRHNIAGRAVPMFAIILVALIATATAAAAAFLIYQSVAAGQVQEQTKALEAPAKKKKKAVHEQQEAGEEESLKEDTSTRKKTEKKVQKSALEQDGSRQDAQQQEQAQAEQPVQQEEAESGDLDMGAEVTTPVESTYDPASEAGSWTGTMVQFGWPTGAVKTGSYREITGDYGVCYGAQQHPLKLNITSVDAASRTASGTVSFLVHGHIGKLGSDESSDPGDAYIENVPFTSISIDGWRSSGAIDLYSGHGKSVQMTLRLKYGSSDDYSVWIRTVKEDFTGPHNLTYTWGQTDMYTITKN